MKIFSKSKFLIHPAANWQACSLFIILLLAVVFRLYGLNWDQSHHLHPDERFLTMVVDALQWPKTLSEYFNPETSLLNPYNLDYGFFVYGTLPLKIVKLASQFIHLDDYSYNNITLVGRLVSAFFDLGTLLLIFRICQKVFNKKIGLLASFLYALSVLPIQLSHFFAVDTFLVFFLSLSFYLLILLISQSRLTRSQYPSILVSIFLGIALGLALACKISALLFSPIILLGLIFVFLKNKNLKLCILHFAFCIFFSYLALRIADPRLFATPNFFNPSINPQFINNIKQLKSFADPQGLFPPSVQWHKTKPIIFPFKNLILWGLGLPLGILAVGGVGYSLYQNSLLFKRLITRKGKPFSHLPAVALAKVGLSIQPLARRSLGEGGFIHFLILFWTLLLFTYQGLQFSKNMRYFYPLYPFIAILSAQFLYQGVQSARKRIKNKAVWLSCCLAVWLLLLIWPLSFLSIYSRPHSRVLASQWIYQNIPAGSTISCEHWDDCLPLGIAGQSPQLYQTETLTLYDQDNPEKWQKTNQQLEKIDYLIMSSNRLWGSIPRLPETYPQTTQFYQDLFAEKLQFKKAAEITSYPTLPILQIPIPDDLSDESFTVYDHPKVLIYKKK